MKKFIKFIIIAFLTFFALSFLLIDNDDFVNNEMDKIELKVALDAEKQYEIAKRNGTVMDAYVQAGMVAAAYLQAKDEENYKKWKKIEEKEGKKLGL